MTDTDKLKRLAEAADGDWYNVDIMLGGNPLSTGAVGAYIASFRPQTILALIAENERLSGALKAANDGFEKHERLWYLAKAERDDAVDLLRESSVMHKDMHEVISGFLARIDAAE